MQFATAALSLLAIWAPSPILAGQVESINWNSGFSIGPVAGSTDNSIPYHFYSASTDEFNNACIEVGDGTKAKALRVEVFKGVRLKWTQGPDGPKCTCDKGCFTRAGPFTIDDNSKTSNGTRRWMWAIRTDE